MLGEFHDGVGMLIYMQLMQGGLVRNRPSMTILNFSPVEI